jgi:hypothetical protein
MTPEHARRRRQIAITVALLAAIVAALFAFSIVRHLA